MAEPTYSNTQYVVEVYTDGDQNDFLTSTFTTMRIINSLRSCWPIVELHFMADNQALIEKNIYGKSDVEVYIWFVDDNGEKVPDPMIWNLLVMESNIVLTQKPEINGTYDDLKEIQRRKIVFSCLSKPSFKTMSNFVNKLYEGDDTTLMPLDIVKEILDQNSIEYRIFEEGKNEETIPQLIIPPMTIKSSIDYLHEKFGIFQGPLFRYANYAGQFCMWDLKERWELTKEDGFTKAHKMPGFTETTGLYEAVSEEVAANPDQFMTYDNVETLNYGNSTVAKYAYDNIFITHPHEDIAYFHKLNTDEIVTEHGLWHDSDELKYHNELKNRKKYYYDWKGFEISDGYTGEYNDYAMRSSLADLFKDAASLKFIIYRKVKISLCTRVGEVVYLQPYSEHEFYPGSSYEGAYLVTDSDVILTKESQGTQDDNIECFANITACRTAQSKD